MYRNEDILKIEHLNSDNFLLTWKMSTTCNYHCSYCTNLENVSTYKVKYTNKDLVEKAIKINKLIRNNNINKLPLKLKLMGGETTLYNLTEILNYIENISQLVIATNFSKDLDYFYDLEDYCKKRNIFLTLICSYHIENKDFITKFIDLTK